MTLRLGDTLIAGSGANTDLSNLTSQGKNIANWSSNVTNCITEIPQDIKVGISNGGLYLKAGCKYCVPNGFEQDGVTPHFDFVTVNADTTPVAYGVGRTGCMAVWSTDHFEWSQTGSFASGSTQPAAGGWWIWYDTANNKIKHSNGSTIVEGVSFPICMITENAGTGYDSTVKSIDHVFNGFGYIGSTVYVLPNVKGLMPNGRNADGTPKSIETTTTAVGLLTYSYPSNEQPIMLVGNQPTATGWYIVSTTEPMSPSTPWVMWYNPEENIMRYSSNNGVWTISNGWLPTGITVDTDNSYRITKFRNPKTVFRALDYSDSSTISGWSMPSGKAISLTVGASGTTYLAPANGYFQVGGNSNVANGYVQLNGNGLDYTFQGWTQGHWGRGFIPVKRGRYVTLVYAGFNFEYFQFVYAEGEENV